MQPLHKITEGFRVAGIYPLNREIFPEQDFLQSYVTDRPLEPSSIEAGTPQAPRMIPELESPDNALPGPSGIQINTPNVQRDLHTPVTSPEAIRLFPKAGKRKDNINRRKRKSVILTGTHVKEELERAKSVTTKAAKKQFFL